MFCTTCGERAEPEDKFCGRCGARVAADAGEWSSANVHVDPASQSLVSGDHESAEEVPPASFPAITPQVQSLFYPAMPPPLKLGMPALLALLAVLMIAGATVAFWILRSSLPGRGTAGRPNVDVAIVPTTAQVAAGDALDFAASVSGAENLEVTWSVQEGEAGGRAVPRGAQAIGGKVSLLAVYIAPGTPGRYHLLVTSKADPKKSAAAEITVTAR
jgi:hypothetical protein